MVYMTGNIFLIITKYVAGFKREIPGRVKEHFSLLVLSSVGN